MSSPGAGRPYGVHSSALIGEQIKKLQEKAEAIGIGALALAAVTAIHSRLQAEPMVFGEPLYRLPALKLQVRVGIVQPLVVHFAVHEERPLVFVKGIAAMPGQGL